MVLKSRKKRERVRNAWCIRPALMPSFSQGQPVHLAIIAAQLAFFDMNVPILGGNSWHNPELFRWAKQDLNGSVFVDGFFLNSPDPSVQMFIQRYRSQYHKGALALCRPSLRCRYSRTGNDSQGCPIRTRCLGSTRPTVGLTRIKWICFF